MKPNPFCALNHFTVPCDIAFTLYATRRPTRRGPKYFSQWGAPDATVSQEKAQAAQAEKRRDAYIGVRIRLCQKKSARQVQASASTSIRSGRATSVLSVWCSTRVIRSIAAVLSVPSTAANSAASRSSANSNRLR
jgi:hypothetical protein